MTRGGPIRKTNPLPCLPCLLCPPSGSDRSGTGRPIRSRVSPVSCAPRRDPIAAGQEDQSAPVSPLSPVPPLGIRSQRDRKTNPLPCLPCLLCPPSGSDRSGTGRPIRSRVSPVSCAPPRDPIAAGQEDQPAPVSPLSPAPPVGIRSQRDRKTNPLPCLPCLLWPPSGSNRSGTGRPTRSRVSPVSCAPRRDPIAAGQENQSAPVSPLSPVAPVGIQSQ